MRRRRDAAILSQAGEGGEELVGLVRGEDEAVFALLAELEEDGVREIAGVEIELSELAGVEAAAACDDTSGGGQAGQVGDLGGGEAASLHLDPWEAQAPAAHLDDELVGVEIDPEEIEVA